MHRHAGAPGPPPLEAPLRASRARRGAAVAALLPALLLPVEDADASWTVSGTGTATVRAEQLVAVTPTATTVGTRTTLGWQPTGFGDPGEHRTVVRRYAPGEETPRSVGDDCALVVAAVTCDQVGVEEGTWRYTVQPRYGPHWLGPEGPGTTVTVVWHRIAELAGLAVEQEQGRWAAEVAAAVEDRHGDPAAAVTVAGSFDVGGDAVEVSCTTGTAGDCTLRLPDLARSQMEVVLSIDTLTDAGHTYPETGSVLVERPAGGGGNGGGGGPGGGGGGGPGNR